MRRRSFPVLALLLIFALIPAGPSAGQAGAPAALPDGDVVTLLTGERVIVTEFPDGRVGYAVRLVDGLEDTTMIHFDRNGERYIFPDYAAPLLHDQLDIELFNVTALLEQGYGDTAAAELPVIVEHVVQTADVPTLDRQREFTSIDAAAARQERQRAPELGRSIAAHREDAAAADPLAGVEKIWLDGRVEATLDVSVPQIGAPDAWAAGYTGDGIQVAVLDSGIDATHPDLAGAVVKEANFSDSPVVTDVAGHGTHVAGIITGSGAASNEKYVGVAPDAELFNGKVLDDFGFGSDSSVLAGMEWAAAEGADIVNMSLSGGPTDGTDPLSQAINELTETTGTLFVVAAGNTGGFAPVNAPGTADAALTVGAVDDFDELTFFSAVGPRIGDFAIKPDITGPGYDIVSARADGASLGPAVDDEYMLLSGTSMATPHAAGAAAILKQLHPDWGPLDLKTALVGSALPNPTLTVYEQGGGRVDVPASLGVEVLPSTATLNLGFFPYPQDDVVATTETLSYTNLGDTAVTLDISIDIADADGLPPEAGMVETSTTSLDLDAGETGSVDITVEPNLGVRSLYGGYVTATDQDGNSVRTPAGFYKEPEMYDVTIEGIDSTGGAGFGDFAFYGVLNVVEGFELATFVDVFDPTIDSLSVRVPPGTYSIIGFSFEGSSIYETAEPEFSVTGDTTVVLDARDTVPVEVTVNEPNNLLFLDVSVERTSEDDFGIGVGVGVTASESVFAEPTDTVTVGGLAHVVHSTHAQGRFRGWDLVFPEIGAIPASLSYAPTPDTTADVVSRFHTHPNPTEYLLLRFGIPEGVTFGSAIGLEVKAPGDRTDTITALPGMIWFTESMHLDRDTFAFLQGWLTDFEKVYEPGEVANENWYEGPSKPTIVEGFGGLRFGDTLVAAIPEFGDAAGHFGFADPGFEGPPIDDISYELYSDGTLLGEASFSFAELPLLDVPADYRLVIETTRTADWWQRSTTTHTEWEFSSAPGEEGFVELLDIRYELPLDTRNRIEAGRTALRLTVLDPNGTTVAPITSLDVWTSTDGGTTWNAVPAVQQTGDHTFVATLFPTSGVVSLRVEAADADGNTISQEIIDVFGVK